MQPMMPPSNQPGSTTANIATGIASFMQQFRASQDLEKNRNWEDFQRDIQLIQLGIQPDMKMVAKHAKGAGLPLDFKGPSKEQIEQTMLAQQVRGQGAPMMERGTTGMQIPGLTFPPSSMGPGGPPPSAGGVPVMMGTPAPAQMPTPPSPSSGEQWLQQLVSNAQMRQKQMHMEHAVNTGKLNIMLGIMSDDPGVSEKSRDLAQKMGILPELSWEGAIKVGTMSGLTPEEAAKRKFWADTGGPQTQQSILQYLQKNAEQVQTQKREIADMAVKTMEQYPAVTLDVALDHAIGYHMGDQDRYLPAQSVINQAKTKGQFELEKQSRSEQREDTRIGLEGRRTIATEAQVGIARQRLTLDEQNQARQEASAAISALLDFHTKMDLMKTGDEKALQGWGNTFSNAMARIKSPVSTKIDVNPWYKPGKVTVGFSSLGKPAEGGALADTPTAESKEAPGWLKNAEKFVPPISPSLQTLQPMLSRGATPLGDAIAVGAGATRKALDPLLLQIMMMVSGTPPPPPPPSVPHH